MNLLPHNISGYIFDLITPRPPHKATNDAALTAGAVNRSTYSTTFRSRVNGMGFYLSALLAVAVAVAYVAAECTDGNCEGKCSKVTSPRTKRLCTV